MRESSLEAHVVVSAALLAVMAPLAWSVGAAPSALPFLLLFVGCALANRAEASVQSTLLAAWPILCWPVLYSAAVDIVEASGRPKFDALLAALDRAILGATAPEVFALGGVAEELANAVYASYYFVVPLGCLWVARERGAEEASRYALAILTAFTACALMWVAVPAGGYHLTGSPAAEPVGPFTAMVRAVYDTHPHHAAAFPSSHVALAFASAGTMVAFGASRWWLLWAALVAWATVQGQYHYLVDSPLAVVVGLFSAWAATSSGAWSQELQHQS